MNKIEVGDLAKDQITGFQGIVIARTEWLNGCARLTIQPQKLKDGKPIEEITFDEHQLVLIKRAGFQSNRDTGGPRPNPIRNRDPR